MLFQILFLLAPICSRRGVLFYSQSEKAEVIWITMAMSHTQEKCTWSLAWHVSYKMGRRRNRNYRLARQQTAWWPIFIVHWEGEKEGGQGYDSVDRADSTIHHRKSIQAIITLANNILITAVNENYKNSSQTFTMEINKYIFKGSVKTISALSLIIF